jgi:hypothetical protein
MRMHSAHTRPFHLTQPDHCRKGGEKKIMKVDQIWFPKQLLVPQLQLNADDEEKQRVRALRQELLQLLTASRFVSFAKHPHCFFDNKLNCLWLFYDFQSQAAEMFEYVSKLQVYAFKEWEIPPLAALRTLAQEPLVSRYDRFRRAQVLSCTPSKGGGSEYQTVRMGDGDLGLSGGVHTVIPIHRVAQRDILSFLVTFSLVPKDVEGVEEKLKELYERTLKLNQGQHPPPPSLKAMRQHLLEGDYIRARLPVLEPAYLYDLGKGLWELYRTDTPTNGTGTNWVQVNLEEPWEARNPERDVRDGVIAIDFGTSATVVACLEQGKKSLIRVGMNDFFKHPTPEDYQNPTILEFIHLPHLLASWTSETYRPMTRWDDFHFSHVALRHFRENEADQRIVASMLTNIKQWPLSDPESRTRRITDQSTNIELEIEPAYNPSPVAGHPLTVNEDDPFDPIELYAYYLGLYINTRTNGLFLEYYITFPTTYPKQVKEQICASFSRGLYRSLPGALLKSPKMARFQVQEEASEPAAYAACALEELNIQPTREGVAYAVFDFGGGSTDFDFGLYRLPSPEEERQGYEEVIEHFGASGDIFLGGENLVANLAYLTFQQNLEVCRKHRIPFICPPEALRFPGHELFIDQSQMAYTNSALLMAKVRPVWESFVWGVFQSGDEIPDTTAEGTTTQTVPEAHAGERSDDWAGYGDADDWERADASSAWSEEQETSETDAEQAMDALDDEPPPHNTAPTPTSTPDTSDMDMRGRRLADRIGDALRRTILTKQLQVDPHINTCQDSPGVISELPIELLNRDREKVQVTFTVDHNALNRYLIQRVGKGIHRLLIAMNVAFDARKTHPPEVHVLLAGNASRSILVQSLFVAILQDALEGWQPPQQGRVANTFLDDIRNESHFPKFIVHRPPQGDPNDPYRPTAKTGVALGLLKLIPGETLLALNTTLPENMDEAPFRYFVGRFRKGTLHPVLVQNGPYMEWHELGVPTRGVFVMAYSTSPQAISDELRRGMPEIQERSLHFKLGTEEKQIYIQAIGPNLVEICLADSLDQIRNQPELIAHQEVLYL